jgi:hypothetical protein
MVRVTVKKAITVFPNGQLVELAAGQVVDGMLAVWLIDSGCEVTNVQDDRPAPAADVDKATAAPATGGLTAALTASADLVHDMAGKPKPKP